ncbi:chemotaxis protein CheB [Paramagnetospirillum marisnigri]|uniref:protein-glutamate methylesterase n=1 Tax=Paramagnetospirillum marisnigri TaxID=1285242 RepID=A0A178MS75_9PROT|nr:chemotaxis protein CheB [Paramagnetospirillum marisnigri]OAN52230.1 chemotaxis protein CheB [Paramagnetospirillum marisnigri]
MTAADPAQGPIHAFAIGCSAGGLNALHAILPELPEGFPAPVVVVAHLGANDGGNMAAALRRDCRLPVVEAEERLPAQAGTVYIAPPDYHLLMEADHTFSLSADAKVLNARPSIDVFMESAAEAWGRSLAAILLTGANADGAAGMAAVKANGGLCIVQDPDGATAPEMPDAAIALGAAHWIAQPDRIAFLMISLCRGRGGGFPE